MPQVWVLQHGASDPLGAIEDALSAQGVKTRFIRPLDGEPVPAHMDAAGLIVLGGAMGVGEQEKYPFLRAEMRLIEDALQRGVPILGVCLGAQILASVLGAPVTRAPRQEIGWFPLTLTSSAAQDPLWSGVASPCPMFHWHGDRFDLPPDATDMASSALTPCQGFRYSDNVYGFQFHLEVTEPMIQDWAASSLEELADDGISPENLLAHRADDWAALHRTARVVFGRWAGLLSPSATQSLRK